MNTEMNTHACRYCKEEIKADALKCKHCGSLVSPEGTSHGGTCPYCKEQIHIEAIKCKHCRSNLMLGITPQSMPIYIPILEWGFGGFPIK